MVETRGYTGYVLSLQISPQFIILMMIVILYYIRSSTRNSALSWHGDDHPK